MPGPSTEVLCKAFTTTLKVPAPRYSLKKLEANDPPRDPVSAVPKLPVTMPKDEIATVSEKSLNKLGLTSVPRKPIDFAEVNQLFVVWSMSTLTSSSSKFVTDQDPADLLINPVMEILTISLMATDEPKAVLRRSKLRVRVPVVRFE
jgi:hypothetical protein